MYDQYAPGASIHTCTVFPVPMSSAISALPLCRSANRTPSLWKLHRRVHVSTTTMQSVVCHHSIAYFMPQDALRQ